MVTVLVLGGTRSGKSKAAESIAAGFGTPVTYLATAVVDPADTDHAARIQAHRQRRPTTWSTIEIAAPAELIDRLGDAADTVLIDSLGTWLTLHPDLAPDIDALTAALAERAAPTVLVSEEVGMSVHPPTELGRRYVDALGELNRRVAEIADRVGLVVAGRWLELGGP